MSIYFEKDGYVIHHGDCREIIPEITGFDVVVTDPPYGVKLSHKQHKWFHQDGTGYESTPDNDSTVEMAVSVMESLVASGIRCVLTPGMRHALKYPQPNAIDCAFNKAGAGLSPWGFQCSQLIYFYGKDPKRPGCYPSGYEQHPNDIALKNGHPCPKPERFWKWLVNRVSNDGETLLDPFLGSGTTLVVAKLLGRKAIGIEIEEKYCEIAARQMEQGVFSFE